MTIEQLLDRSPYVLGYCHGVHAFTGRPRWDESIGPKPDLVVLLTTGTVLLLDREPEPHRSARIRAWCAAATAEGRWLFCYHRLSPRVQRLLLLGRIT